MPGTCATSIVAALSFTPARAAALAATLSLTASLAGAQTDFHNTDRGRPLATEDALVIERRAFELQLLPIDYLRLSRGASQLGVAPALAWGALPRTQFELALPLAMDTDADVAHPLVALAGIELEAMHQFNLETTRLPAFALGAGVHLPAGPAGPERALTTLRALATRTRPWGRMHVNASFSPDAGSATSGDEEPSRWSAGIAADHTFALRSLLVGAELTARETAGGTVAPGAADSREVDWRVAIGARKQLTPRVAMDAGVSRRLTTGAGRFGFTIGAAYAFAPPWMPGFAVHRAEKERPLRTRDSYEQFYLPASHNFAFRDNHPKADRLFNAFDYGHAVLYEKLWTEPATAKTTLEGREYRFLTEELLVRPPRLPLVEEAIEPMYSLMAPEAKAMFEWAHILHRQVYDVLADERLDEAARERALARVQAYYLSRPELAFSTRPKSMALMQEQPYSLAFREGFPKFNGLIWSYHWLQVGLYEPLVVGRTAAERRALVEATVGRFRQMLPDAPHGFPVMMPMTGAIAPEFTRRWPTLAILFDNLHSMHDVISDILANPAVPRHLKRGEIMRAAAAYRDDTTEVMTVEAWQHMSHMMGIENQGGPAVGFPPELAKPTVPRGFVMRHDKEGNPLGGHDH